MSGEFYMEYDSSRGISSDDVNRDGRFSFSEFSMMLAKQAFVQWEYCGTTISGVVINPINIVAADNTADFEFALTLPARSAADSAATPRPKTICI